MFSQLTIIDRLLTTSIRTSIPHTVLTDQFFSFLSVTGYSLILWFLIILALIYIEEKRDKKFVLYFVASIVLTIFIVNFPLKTFFHRTRPIIDVAEQLTYVCPRDFSFPSGHSATAFAAATILTLFDRKRWWAYMLIAGLIGLSRIYLGCHYLSDVIAGAIVGAAISFAVLAHRRFSSRS